MSSSQNLSKEKLRIDNKTEEAMVDGISKVVRMDNIDDIIENINLNLELTRDQERLVIQILESELDRLHHELQTTSRV